MASREQRRIEFKSHFQELCQNLIEKSVSIGGELYYPSHLEGLIPSCLRKLGLIASVRLADVPSDQVPADWKKSAHWRNSTAQLLRDTEALREFAQECPFESLSDLQGHSHGKKGSHKNTPTFNEALTELLTVIHQSPHQIQLALSAIERISKSVQAKR